MKFPTVGGCPHFGPQEPLAHLDQPMTEVDEHDIVTPSRHIVIEDDWTDFLRVGMLESLGAAGPLACERRQPEGLLTANFDWLQRELTRELQTYVHHLVDVLGRYVEVSPRFLELLVEPSDALA